MWLVGRTDSVGRFEDNIWLSEDRAKSVESALATTPIISEAHMTAKGVRPLHPLRATAQKMVAGRIGELRW